LDGRAEVASAATPDSVASNSYGDAFIGGDTAKGCSNTPSKSNGPTVQGDSGFPGLFGAYPGDQG
jgi:hypothetical protein